MTLALGPSTFRDTPLLELPALVADLGYEWIELSPRDDYVPFFSHPPVDDAGVAAFRSALSAAGVGVSSVLPSSRGPALTRAPAKRPCATGSARSRSRPTSASTR